MSRDRIVYIENDLPIEMDEQEYEDSFTEEEREELESGSLIEWEDEEGEFHNVGLIEE